MLSAKHGRTARARIKTRAPKKAILERCAAFNIKLGSFVPVCKFHAADNVAQDGQTQADAVRLAKFAEIKFVKPLKYLADFVKRHGIDFPIGMLPNIITVF